jgi:hypothetical protein
MQTPVICNVKNIENLSDNEETIDRFFIGYYIESSAKVLSPLLEERARERGGCLKSSVYIYSPPQPSP